MSFRQILLYAAIVLFIACSIYGCSSKDNETIKLINMLGSDDWKTGSMAITQLIRIGEDAVPLLIKACENEDNNLELRWGAVIVLGEIGLNAREAEESLLKLLDDKAWEVRDVSAKAIGQIGANPEPAVSKLTELLEDEEAYVRSAAAESLLLFGLDAIDAVPNLIELLNDEDNNVRISVTLTLAYLNPSIELIPFLKLMIENDNPKLRSAGVRGFGIIGMVHKDAIKYLNIALDDDDVRVRLSAIQSLGEIGPFASEALDKLRELSKYSPSMSIEASKAIRKIENTGSTESNVTPHSD